MDVIKGKTCLASKIFVLSVPWTDLIEVFINVKISGCFVRGFQAFNDLYGLILAPFENFTILKEETAKSNTCLYVQRLPNYPF